MVFAGSRVHRRFHAVTVWATFAALALALALVPVVTQAQSAVHADALIDVMINGVRLENRGVVYGDRTYVSLADVADIIGARYTYDPISNVAFLQTGNFLNLNLEGIRSLNPKFAEYYDLTEPLDDVAGLQFVAPGSYLGALFSLTGELLAYNYLIPADLGGHFPWYEQPEGAPVDHPSLGEIYTQHLYVVDPALIRSSSGSLEAVPLIAFNGNILDLDDDAIGWFDDELYVRMKDLAEASGGGVVWYGDMRLASAKIVPGLPFDFMRLLELNDLGHYEYLGYHDPRYGYYFGMQGPGIYFTGVSDMQIPAVVEIIPTDISEWQPWFDEEDPFEWIHLIHHFLMPPDEIPWEELVE